MENELDLENSTIFLKEQIFTEKGIVDELPDMSKPPSDDDIEKWIDYQKNIYSLINKNSLLQLSDIKIVAGLDISYEPTNQKDKTYRMYNGLAAITIHDYKTTKFLKCFTMKFKTSVPYIKGLLSLREVPVFSEMLNQIRIHHRHYNPDLLIVDGLGQWHHTYAGSATILSLSTRIPAIGIGKDFLEIPGVTASSKEFKIQRNLEAKNKGDMIIMHRKDDGNLMGIVYNSSGAMQIGTQEASNNAFIYITIGDRTDLLTSLIVVKHLSLHKNCEPIRTSDFAASYFFKTE